MRELKESLLDNTNTKIGQVKSHFNSLGHLYVLSDFDMWMSTITFAKYIDTDKLNRATENMEIISDTLTEMLTSGYAQRMSRQGQAWDNICNIWTWIDNFEWKPQTVNYDSCQVLVDAMNKKAEEQGLFKGKFEFRVWSAECRGRVSIALRMKRKNSSVMTYEDNLLEFTIRRKR
jgi:hypothetical protein